jgi:hypothetical protein
MQGVVQKVEFTKNGSRKLQIDGAWYFAGKVNVDSVKSGDRIDFTFEEFGEDRGKGRLKGLKGWEPVRNASGQPQTGSTISDADILRSVSNVVGSACAAGTIKDPVELEKWFCAAWAGFTRRQKAANGKDPEFDDEIPDGFYGDRQQPSKGHPNAPQNGDDPGW